MLEASPKARRILREVHPEICFWSLAGCKPMDWKKSTVQGVCERLDVLKQLWPAAEQTFRQILNEFRRSEVAKDDILDAAAAAITASAQASSLKTLPEEPETDNRGLPMEMVYVLREEVAPAHQGPASPHPG